MLLRHLGLSLLAAVPIAAQAAPIPHRIVHHPLRSGSFDNPGSDPVVVLEKLVRVPGVPWLRLQVSSAHLPANSCLEVVSLLDGHHQRLDEEAMRIWRNTSAYFNGEALLLRLIAGPGARDVRFEMRTILAGASPNPGPGSICGGTDDRVPSSDRRVARVLGVGCTAWLIDATNCFVSAGHCCASSAHSVVQFNVPPSSSGGAPRHPPPQDQYTVDTASKVFVNGGLGNDWCVFKTRRNTTTGKHAGEAQGAFFRLRTSHPSIGAAIRITGYGVTSPRNSRSQTQQTHVGPLRLVSGNRLCYHTDTTGGNSGSPVIDDATGLAIAVHTHGGCGSSSSSCNSGTSVLHSAFAQAIRNACGGTSAAFTTFGIGCAGSNGARPALSATGLPRLGTTYTVRLAGALPRTNAVLVVGDSDKKWLDLPLPARLDAIGARGCTLYVSVDDDFAAITDASGRSSADVFVPDDRSLAGLTIFFQWLCRDAAANTFGWTFSSAGKAVYGF